VRQINGAGIARDAVAGQRRLERLCDDGLPLACANLAGSLISEPPPDVSRANALSRAACVEGEPLGCWMFGRLQLDAPGLDGADFDAAAARGNACLAHSCARGHASSCVDLGAHHLKGTGVARSREQALSFYEQGCDLGSTFGCVQEALVLLAAEPKPEEVTWARDLLTDACDKGSAVGCGNLGVLYGLGRGVAKDLPRAVKLYEQACEAKEFSFCYALGLLHQSGTELPKDLKKATLYYERACSGGDGKACTNLAVLVSADPGAASQSRAVELYRRACELNDELACENLKRRGL
jgi:TPR repeat protein